MTARLRRFGRWLEETVFVTLALAIPIGLVFLAHVWGYLWYS